ncbi:MULTISPECIES: DNA double-strand break repair protein Mre11 [Salinibaculum]|uniref:DNA double-strand break repair protein Mre11 n=1 Tax=Salinibaculum TaxID=2732368 RepID=UPI0030D3E4AB
MTRVIHTGDTHLGYQQYHRPERREDFLRAFQRVAADAVAEGVDAVVHAGDLFHDRRPTLPDIMGALSVLRDLDDADVPFLAIVGNHESKRDAQWLDLFESLGLATRLGPDPVQIGDTAFYGLDFVPRSKRDDLDYDFTDHDAETAALVSHGLFEPFPHGDWDARKILRESDVRFDALLFGDDHKPQTKQVEEPHEAWLTYCGSTERASASEREDRGYNLVTFDSGVDIRRRGLDTREFVFVDVDLGAGEGVERVRERVGQYDMEDAVVVVSIDGEGDPVAPATIEEYADERGALVARVTDHRELTDETETEVSFADPDEAVRERIRDLGLSSAARDLDETIRASKVADANVADTVEDRVADLVDEDDGDAFGTGGESDTGSGGADAAAADAEPDDSSENGAAGENTDSQVTMGDYT